MSAQESSSVVRIGEWTVHPALDSISRGSETQKLEPRAMRLLLCLANAAGEVVSIERLLTEVWAGVVVGSASVYEAVSQLRKILGDVEPQPTYIVTVPRKGYRLIASVQRGPVPADIPEAALMQPKTARLLRVWVVAGAFVIVLALTTAYFLEDGIWFSKRIAVKDETHATNVVVSDKSVAVLPFVDMSEMKDQEYFADGMAEEIIDLLVKIPELKVIARTSSFYFKGKQVTIQDIANTLGVAHVLEGSVRKVGNTVRVTAELVRSSTGAALWSQTFDRDVTDIFKVQDEIAAAVVGNLKLKVLSGQAFESADRSANPEAYYQFLLGRQIGRNGNLEDSRHALTAFRNATQLDPAYAAAYAGVAMYETHIAEYSNDTAGYERARAAAEKALALAPQLAIGYRVRCYVKSDTLDLPGAFADAEKAMELEPRDARVQNDYGVVLSQFGRVPEAIAAMERSIEIDPLAADAWVNLGYYLTAVKNFPAARRALNRSLVITPTNGVAHNGLGTLDLLEGRLQDALAEFQNNSDDVYRQAGEAKVEYSRGHEKESQRVLDALIAKHGENSPYAIAGVYAWRGDRDKAFEWLERSYRRRDSDISDIKRDPLLTGLRGDPRYRALLKRLNLPE
jgi:TolB-like protein/DNA-binding winged helix-turn-helix (wHTH) protein/Flp pilus assembly protein TadD